MFHLICVHEFGSYKKGQLITDQSEVERLMGDRDHHFVRIHAPVAEPVATVEPVASTDEHE